MSATAHTANGGTSRARFPPAIVGGRSFPHTWTPDPLCYPQSHKAGCSHGSTSSFSSVYLLHFYRSLILPLIHLFLVFLGERVLSSLEFNCVTRMVFNFWSPSLQFLNGEITDIYLYSPFYASLGIESMICFVLFILGKYFINWGRVPGLALLLTNTYLSTSVSSYWKTQFPFGSRVSETVSFGWYLSSCLPHLRSLIIMWNSCSSLHLFSSFMRGNLTETN